MSLAFESFFFLKPYILGDSAYPLSPYLLTPIVGAAPNTPEGQYTRVFTRVRNTVERSIGLLKSIFRCLNSERVLHYKPTKAAKIIYASAILYNYMIDRRIIPYDIDFVAEGKYIIRFSLNIKQILPYL